MKLIFWNQEVRRPMAALPLNPRVLIGYRYDWLPLWLVTGMIDCHYDWLLLLFSVADWPGQWLVLVDWSHPGVSIGYTTSPISDSQSEQSIRSERLRTFPRCSPLGLIAVWKPPNSCANHRTLISPISARESGGFVNSEALVLTDNWHERNIALWTPGGWLRVCAERSLGAARDYDGGWVTRSWFWFCCDTADLMR